MGRKFFRSVTNSDLNTVTRAVTTSSPLKLVSGLLLTCMITAGITGCNTSSSQQSQAGQCPQQRHTEMAPASIAALKNPLQANEKNISAGEDLFTKTAKPVACMQCHGDRGDGNGPMANMFDPAPRNFTCSEVVSSLPDGQFFWIIKNGSIGTSMPAFDKLSDEQVWQLTLYIRSLIAKPQT